MSRVWWLPGRRGIGAAAGRPAAFPQQGTQVVADRRATREDRAVSQTAVIIAVTYGIAVAIGVVISVAIWQSTRASAEELDPEPYSRREGAWLLVVLAALFALLLATIFYVPYGETAGAGKQVVRVTGVQFAWAVTPAVVEVGRPVEFLLTTRDVNHGFGVYSEGGVLAFQAQVMPDRTQKVVHTFDEPGTYTVLCLEFCGVRHHEMEATIEVRG
jgi:cytochrome c oxidase subunit 2